MFVVILATNMDIATIEAPTTIMGAVQHANSIHGDILKIRVVHRTPKMCHRNEGSRQQQRPPDRVSDDEEIPLFHGAEEALNANVTMRGIATVFHATYLLSGAILQEGLE